MCGILGVVGEPGALDTILDGLKRLEYRGYDSAGVALLDGGALLRVRTADGTRSVDVLRDACAGLNRSATVGIGHTRWATHGGVSVANAHPHVDCGDGLAVIHNGIIENHDLLRADLVAKGHVFTSSTDTEVMVHLLEDELKCDGDLRAAMARMLPQLRGAFAVAAVSAAHPDRIVAARRVSPLVVGMTDTVAYLGSDVPALMGRVDSVLAVDEDCVVELTPGHAVVTDVHGVVVDAPVVSIDFDVEVADLGRYADFMTKEIDEQPAAVADTVAERLENLFDQPLDADVVAAIDKIVLVGCGSSYHAAMVGRVALESWAKIPAEIDIASEFRYRDAILSPTTLVIGVSQSGETIDTLEAMKHARRKGATVVAVSNIPGASMTREANASLLTKAGLEVSVASTKTVLAQVVVLQLLAISLGEARGVLDAAAATALRADLQTLPAALRIAVDDVAPMKDVANALATASSWFFLGRGSGLPVALEGALKLKEISYARAEGYPAGELKHGPIALIEPGVVVVAIVLPGPSAEKMYSNIAEVKARGATLVIVAPHDDHVVEGLGDFVVRTVPSGDAAAPLLAMVPLQHLAYAVARARGLEVDRPRHLAKTVTVE